MLYEKGLRCKNSSGRDLVRRGRRPANVCMALGEACGMANEKTAVLAMRLNEENTMYQAVKLRSCARLLTNIL